MQILEKDNCFVSYKQLTDADMGRSMKSHQTHIGLFEDSFVFLQNDETVDDCIFLCYGEEKQLPLLYGRMQSADGEWRSPKIRKGDSGQDTILSVIRNIAGSKLELDCFYLLWFALPSSRIVFWLIPEDSDDFNELHTNKIITGIRGKIEYESDIYECLIKYLSKIYPDVLDKQDESDDDGVDEADTVKEPAKTYVTVVRDSDGEDEEDDVSEYIKTDDSDPGDGTDIPSPRIYRSSHEAIENYMNRLMSDHRIQTYSFENSKSDYCYDLTYTDQNGHIVFCFVTEVKSRDDEDICIYSDMLVSFKFNSTSCFNFFRIRETDDGGYELSICRDPVKQLHAISDILDETMDRLADTMEASFGSFSLILNANKFPFTNYFRI